jgi:SAM-dependent MidA family methyltransferase
MPVRWTDTFDAMASQIPLFLIANEFFDALPIRQFVSVRDAWTERHVTLNEQGQFIFCHLPTALPSAIANWSVIATPPDCNRVIELCEAARAIAGDIGARLRATGGLTLIIDYGHAASGLGDTLQAVKAHRFTDPLETPGESDLTAHVDFEALHMAAAARSYGTVTQRAFLKALGIDARAASLAGSQADRAPAVMAGLTRLTDDAQMGTLFKVMAVTGPHGPDPAGFAPCMS